MKKVFDEKLQPNVCLQLFAQLAVKEDKRGRVEDVEETAGFDDTVSIRCVCGH